MPANAPYFAPIRSLSQSRCAARLELLHSLHQATLARLPENDMSSILSRHTQVASLVLAVLMTTAIHGSLLLGFNAAAGADAASPTNLVTLPTVTIVAARG